jgi:hypothetical protein
MRYFIALALVLSVPAMLAKPPQGARLVSGGRKIPCKVPENASMCYWTRGRLQYYNGTPSYRLWKIGTTRLLGIYSGPTVWTGDHLIRDNENPEYPTNVASVFAPPGNRIFADFEVCPLEPERAGFMQAACIESAKNIFVEKP